MGTIGVVIAPAATVAAHSSAAPQNAQAENTAAKTATTANPGIAAQAAVVTLSANSKGRAASSGSDRFVDSPFEKQETKESKKEGKEGRTKGAVDVKA